MYVRRTRLGENTRTGAAALCRGQVTTRSRIRSDKVELQTVFISSTVHISKPRAPGCLMFEAAPLGIAKGAYKASLRLVSAAHRWGLLSVADKENLCDGCKDDPDGAGGCTCEVRYSK